MTIVSTSTYAGAGAPSFSPASAPAAPAATAPAPAATAPVAAPSSSAPAAAPVAAPASAPAAPLSLEAPPAADPIAAPAPAASGEAQVVSYEKTGNAGLDMALNFLGKHGYGPDHPAMQAAAEGNFLVLKADLASRSIPGAAEYVALGEEAFKVTKASTDARVAEDRAKIISAVGGEKQWADVQAWAAKNAEPAERATISQALAAGGIVARMVARGLAEAHAKAAGTVINPAEVTNGNSVSVAATTGALSPEQFKQGIAELKARVGSANLDSHPEYKALTQRRMAYRA